MKEGEIKGEDLKGLEDEIDQAIDSLFVEKGRKGGQVPSADISMISDEEEEASDVEMESLSGEPERQSPSIVEESLVTAGEAVEESQERVENNIDRAIDSLFVESENEKEIAQTTEGEAFHEPEEPPIMESGPPIEEETAVEVSIESEEPPIMESGPPMDETTGEVPTESYEPGPTATDGALRNLENLETNLLSLEWEISPDFINKIISELGFLKEAYQNDQAIFQVAEVMEKVAHSLADDEGNITPDNLRFLLEAKNAIKLLGTELKDRTEYKNLVLSGILAKHKLMRDQPGGKAAPKGPSEGEPDFQSLTQDLRAVSKKLHMEIRQLGSITEKLRGKRVRRPPSAMSPAVLIESCGRFFAVEKETVLRSVQIPYRMARTVWGGKDIRIRGVRLPLVNLVRLFRLKGRIKPEDKVVLVVQKGDRTLALLADRLLYTRSIPLKRIREEKRLAYVRGIVPIGKGRNIYFLDTERLIVEF